MRCRKPLLCGRRPTNVLRIVWKAYRYLRRVISGFVLLGRRRVTDPGGWNLTHPGDKPDLFVSCCFDLSPGVVSCGGVVCKTRVASYAKYGKNANA